MLHSCIVRACIGRAIVTAATKAAAQTATERINMVTSLFSVLSLQRFGTPDDPMGFQPERRPVTAWQTSSASIHSHHTTQIEACAPKRTEYDTLIRDDRAHDVSRCRAQPFVKVTRS